MSNGDPNPLARGLLISNATLALVKDAAGANFALDARGLVSLVGFGDVEASGEIHVRVNSFQREFDEVFAIPGTDQEVFLTFVGEDQQGDGTTPYALVSGLGLKLKLFGQELSADLTFEKDDDGLRVAVENAELSFTDTPANATPRGPPIVSLTNGSGEILFAAAGGVVGAFQSDLSLDLPGVSLDASVKVLFNTMTHDGTLESGPVTTVPAGPYFRIEGQDLDLTIVGQTLHADFTFEQSTSGAETTTTLTVDDASLTLGGGGASLGLNQGHGELVISTAGIAGRFGAHVSASVPGFDLSAGVEVAINTTASASATCPPAPTSASRRTASSSPSPARRSPATSPSSRRSTRTPSRSSASASPTSPSRSPASSR